MFFTIILIPSQILKTPLRWIIMFFIFNMGCISVFKNHYRVNYYFQFFIIRDYLAFNKDTTGQSLYKKKLMIARPYMVFITPLLSWALWFIAEEVAERLEELKVVDDYEETVFCRQGRVVAHANCNSCHSICHAQTQCKLKLDKYLRMYRGGRHQV